VQDGWATEPVLDVEGKGKIFTIIQTPVPQ